MNLIQSTFGNTQHGNFELVVCEGSALVHNTATNEVWQPVRNVRA